MPGSRARASRKARSASVQRSAATSWTPAVKASAASTARADSGGGRQPPSASALATARRIAATGARGILRAAGRIRRKMPFIVLEGIEGSGKSTQCRRLGEALGGDVVVTQEPGGTSIGRSIREVLLDPGNAAMTAEAELLLYFADRAQHVREVVLPALRAGRTVISDRYVQSTRAYQGYGRGIALDTIDTLWRVATGGLAPDLLLLLEVPVEVGLERVRERGAADRLETEQLGFYQRVVTGYRRMVAEDPERWAVVDGTGDPAAVTPRLLEAIEARGLAPRLHGIR